MFDEIHTSGISYAQLDDFSGRIYNWLKSQGIGKEDFVLINLPRGIQPIIAMIGVWKAGAAWALVEDTYAPERIDFIRQEQKSSDDVDMDEKNAQAMQKEHILTPEQIYMIDYQLYTPNSTMYNLFSVMRLEKGYQI